MHSRPLTAVDKCDFRMGCVRSQVFVLVKPSPVVAQPSTAIWTSESTAGYMRRWPFGQIWQQRYPTEHPHTHTLHKSHSSINHTLPCINHTLPCISLQQSRGCPAGPWEQIIHLFVLQWRAAGSNAFWPAQDAKCSPW